MKRFLRTGLILVLGVFAMSALAQDGRASLLDAAAGGRAAEVSRLIAAGADLDIRDAQGRSPLLLAVAGNHIAVAKALLAAGANINAQAANRDTPWLLAGAAGRAEIVAAMIPLKPDLTIRNRYGGNALIPACERAHVETVKLLLTSGIDLNHVNDLGWTCLLEIVILGDGGTRHQEVAKLVLDAGADPSLADKDGVSPLAHARQRGQRAVAALIEKAGGR
ncbi:Ankyrin repeat protein [Bosea sp. LC85]|uniref:ankyrin repeat domain-containing protein n=1 Tax=Bosea sp. LC85 TaxID=1502851 RepID=UPI0004E40DF6|nr:ankyrin repeat domain-containing protein [Bosea sp. LC85]KFC72928.1 Ankyrin repeat protein [Bosea sp. LC85]